MEPPPEASKPKRELPVFSLFALTIPLVTTTAVLLFRHQTIVILIGLLAFFIAIPCFVICLLSVVSGERPRWLAGAAFVANALLIYSLTFINIH